jgi:membrane protein DedA with SNARE-associated domain
MTTDDRSEHGEHTPAGDHEPGDALPPPDEHHLLGADEEHHPPPIEEFRGARRWRNPLLALAVLRYLIPLAAIPLFPVLVPDRVALLTLLRPGREVLLLAGGLTRTQGDPGILPTFLAFIPLMVLGVWVFFALGRAWAEDLRTGDGPDWLHRMLPPERMEVGYRVLANRGPLFALIARIAGLPPTFVAAAAGASDVSSRAYLLADGVGAVIHFGMVFGIGLALGQAYERGGPWMTGVGLVLVIIAAIWVSNWLQAEAERS